MNTAFGLALVGVGLLMAWGGVTGQSVVGEIRAAVRGEGSSGGLRDSLSARSNRGEL